MNEPKTLFDYYVEAFSFGVSWTPFQTANLLFLVILFYFYSGIAKRGIAVGTVIVFSSAYLVINQIVWWAFLLATSWDSGEQIFNYGFEYFLPACSFYLGMIALLGLVCTTVHILKQRKEFALRKWVSVLIACIILMVGVTMSARTPIAFQKLLDKIEPRVEQPVEGAGCE